MTSQAVFSYALEDIDKIERSLSPERFRWYVKAAKGDRAKAVRLYERNTSLSEALYGLIQGFEVPFRNAITRLLSDAYGAEWYLAIKWQYAQENAVAEAEKAIRNGQKDLTPGRVVSQLTLGFWTALIGSVYEKALWVPCLHRAFPTATKSLLLSTGQEKVVTIARHEISKRVNEIKTLRNRIAHHECILPLASEKTYCDIVEAIHWLCPTTAIWVGSTNSFRERFSQRCP